METNNNSKDIETNNKVRWYSTSIRIGVIEMIVILVFFVGLLGSIFYLNFGTLNISEARYYEGINSGGNETVDFEKYQVAYFISPGETGRIFATKITNPTVIYTLGFIDKKFENSEKRLGLRLSNIEKENVLLRKAVENLTDILSKETKR